MHRHSRFTRFTCLATSLALSLIAVAATAQESSLVSSSNVAGHVYVNNNSSGQNTISGFDRHADGSLTPIGHNGVFATGGAGSGMPVATQGAIQYSADHRYVLAVDPGSNEISVLQVKHNGTLQARGTVSSGGNVPGSLAVSAPQGDGNAASARAARGSLVYVANTGAGGANYTGFTLNPGGHLTAIDGSTFALPDNAFPGQILFSSDGAHAAGTRTGHADRADARTLADRQLRDHLRRTARARARIAVRFAAHRPDRRRIRHRRSERAVRDQRARWARARQRIGL